MIIQARIAFNSATVILSISSNGRRVCCLLAVWRRWRRAFLNLLYVTFHSPYSLLSILSTSISFPYSLKLTESQYLKPFAESQIREILSPTHTHTHWPNVIVIGRGRVTTLLSTSSIRVLKSGSIRDNTSHPRFNNESYHFSGYDKSNRAIWFDKREEWGEWNRYSCEGSSCRMR